MNFKEFIYFNKNKIVVSGICLIFIIVGIVFFYYGNQKNDLNLSKEEPLLLENNLEDKTVTVLCYFDIKGEVVKPGVYAIECDKRVNDAIILSGGLTKNSDTSVLNLSKKIEDGMVIVVYSKKEVIDFLETLKKEEQKQSLCANSNVVNDACIINSNNSNSSNSSLININTASLSELMQLTGIGESKAKNIIFYREKTPFKNIEDILNVEGIGESIYVNIKKNITV